MPAAPSQVMPPRWSWSMTVALLAVLVTLVLLAFELWRNPLPALVLAALVLVGGGCLLFIQRRAAVGATPAPRLSGWAVMLCGASCIALARAMPLAAWCGVALFVGYHGSRYVHARTTAGGVKAAEPATHQARPTGLVENLIGLLSAAVFIVASYTFVLEAFRIPTGSMEPTLYGDPVFGDRALVNRLSYRLHAPERDDICVLRFPLERATPYVKRLIGFPGETILIAEGDVYLKGKGDAWPRVHRRQGRARDNTWLPTMSFTGGEADLHATFDIEGTARALDGVIHLVSDQPVRLGFPKGASVVDHNPTRNAEHDPLYGHAVVSDLRICLELDPAQTSEFVIEIERYDGRAELRVFHGEGSASPTALMRFTPARAESRPVSAEYALSAGRQRLDFVAADGRMALSPAGECFGNNEPLMQLDFETGVECLLRIAAEAGHPYALTNNAELGRLTRDAFKHSDRAPGRIYLSARRAEISNLRVYRDIYYLGRLPLQRFVEGQRVAWFPRLDANLPYAHTLADDEYFVLGDNSQNSLDSRLWFTLELETEDDKTYRFQLDHFVRLLAQKNEGKAIEFRALAMNSAMGVEPLTHLESLCGEVRDAIRRGEFGAELVLEDVYPVTRRIRAVAVRRIDVKHRPGVPVNLMDGVLLGSVAPVPRFPD